jgi:hypothetical protein
MRCLVKVNLTHVYASGETGVSFSDLDFAMFVARLDLPLLMAQSGNDLFAIVRTPQTARVVPPDFLGEQFYTVVPCIVDKSFSLWREYFDHETKTENACVSRKFASSLRTGGARRAHRSA